MRLSKHFIGKWIDLMGYRPGEKEIEGLIKQAICIQQFREIRQANGQFFYIPAIFWNYRHGLLFKIDESRNTVITVYVGRPRRHNDLPF